MSPAFTILSLMLARGLSASLHGLEAKPVTVEEDLPDKAIQESWERVHLALRNSGFSGPLVRVVINLAQAYRRREGPAFYLPTPFGSWWQTVSWTALGSTVFGDLVN